MDGMMLLRAERGLMAKVARELGIQQSAVSQWPRVPTDKLLRVSEISGIPAHQLRPDLAELAEAMQQRPS